MSCSRTQHSAASGDRTQDLSIQSLTLYHYITVLPRICESVFTKKFCFFLMFHTTMFQSCLANAAKVLYKAKTERLKDLKAVGTRLTAPVQ